jgi:hypothetical protein
MFGSDLLTLKLTNEEKRTLLRLLSYGSAATSKAEEDSGDAAKIRAVADKVTQAVTIDLLTFK